ncbi:amidohydrolase [Sphingomonas sp. SUN039]|uniref:amidohydrolase n=1 Tax=Sphingomonas sp. SUN039 TaxID=2937787 RepID=UPI0021644A5F|nr:amidohydrolase [Sphingomonas sp. SUN039]UVO54868.1 amidohydrolase [Sphingomonas sp. SUN039]
MTRNTPTPLFAAARNPDRHLGFDIGKVSQITRAITAAILLALGTPAVADGLVDNVNGITLDDKGQVVRFTGLTVTADGKVGRLIRQGEKPSTDKNWRADWRLDGKNRTLLPGLFDAHGHVMGLGIAALTLDLSETKTLAEAQAKVADYAKAHPERRWIIGRGWNQEVWGLGRFPTAADLDAVVADKPVLLERVDGHAVWANSAALAAAGVTAKSVSPPGGRIEKLASGAPTGVLVDAASALVEKAVPQPLPAERELALASAQDVLLSLGITAIADMGTSPDDWNAMRRAGDKGALRVRIISYANSIDTALSVAGSGPTPWLYDDRLRMVGIKMYADGALGSRGACLKKPYADAPGQTGLCFLDDTKMRNIMSRAAMNNLQVATHAIGDAANAQVLGAIEELVQTYKGDRRWRIEHAQIVDPADLPRFGKNGIIASMQPVHQTSDRKMAEARLDPPRLAGAYAWASMLKNGSVLAFGSDVPVESANPFPGLAAAITREGADGQPFGGWQPQERISREAALAAFTTGAAFAGQAEDRIGRLAPGYRADFVLVDVDPLLSTPAQLRATKVSETWIGGKRAFKAK